MANIAFVGGNNPIKVGISCLSSYLKSKGHNVIYCGTFIDTRFFKATPDLNIEKYIENFPVDLFAFSAMSHDYLWSIKTANTLKKKYPKIPIIFGGPLCTILPETVLDNPAVDYVCVGDGEKPLAELLSAIENKEPQEKIEQISNICYKRNGRKIIKKISYIVENLSDYPYPDFELYKGKVSTYHLAYPIVISSRGCPFNCTYCSTTALRERYKSCGKYVRQHRVDYMIDYLSFLKQKYKVKAFQLMDDVFTLDKEWLLDFLKLYARKIRLPYTCITNPLTIDEEVAKALSKTNCRLVYIGLQSGSERIRGLIKRPETDERVFKMTKLLKKYKVTFSINHIFDFPFDTDKEDYDSAIFYSRIRPSLIDTFSLFYLPKSEIINDGVKFGVLTRKDLVDSNRGYLLDYHKTNKIPGRKSHYDRYNIFFNLIPVIPRFILKHLLKNEETFIKTSRFLSFIPVKFSALIKLILSIKNRCFFVQMTFFPDALFFLKLNIKKITEK